MMRPLHVRVAAALATFVLAATAVAPAFASSPVNLVIDGSTTLMPLAQKWAAVYKSLNAGSKISVSGGGSGTGVNHVEAGSTDLGMSSAAKKTGTGGDPSDVIFTPVARDAVVIVVNPKLWNTTSLYKMTPAMVKKIFLGQVRTWNQVDSRLPSKTIVLKGRGTTSGTYSYFKSTFLGGAKQAKMATYSSNGMVRSAVEGDKYAIGYLAMSYVTTKVKALNLLMPSGSQAGHYVVPSKTNALNGKYVFVRDLFFLTKGALSASSNAQAKKFVDWCLTSKGQSYNAALGYLPLH